MIRDRSESPVGPGGLVGCINVSNVVAGRFLSATMGYNAFDGYAGTGMFAEGLGLVVGIAFAPAPEGMGLHRVEANVRIANERSAGVLRSLGFRKERTVRRMLWLADGLGGSSAWRDHDSYAVTVEEWPAQPYAEHNMPQGVLVVDARVGEVDVLAVARELGVVALVGLPYESALTIVRHSAAPVVWAAGAHTSQAVATLRFMSRAATDVSERLVGAGRSPRDAARAALAVRAFLG